MDSSEYKSSNTVVFETNEDYEVMAAVLTNALALVRHKRHQSRIMSLAEKIIDCTPEFGEDELNPLVLSGQELDLAARSVRLYANQTFRDIDDISEQEANLRLRAFDLYDEFRLLGIIDKN